MARPGIAEVRAYDTTKFEDTDLDFNSFRLFSNETSSFSFIIQTALLDFFRLFSSTNMRYFPGRSLLAATTIGEVITAASLVSFFRGFLVAKL